MKKAKPKKKKINWVFKTKNHFTGFSGIRYQNTLLIFLQEHHGSGKSRVFKGTEALKGDKKLPIFADASSETSEFNPTSLHQTGGLHPCVLLVW